MALDLVPISAYGGGVVALPWEGVVLSAMVLDPSGTPTNNDISEAFDDGVDGRRQRSGDHQAVRARRSSDRGRLLEQQDPPLADPGPVQRRPTSRRGASSPCSGIPARSSGGSSSGSSRSCSYPVQPANREDNTWTVFYGFDQYFWHPGGDQKRGIGMFFNFGASDGEREPGQVQLQRGNRGQRGRAGAPARHLRGRLDAHPVQRQLRAVPAPAARPRPRPRGRGRDVLQRRRSRGGST